MLVYLSRQVCFAFKLGPCLEEQSEARWHVQDRAVRVTSKQGSLTSSLGQSYQGNVEPFAEFPI